MQATSEINVKEALQNDWNAVTFNFLSNIIRNRLLGILCWSKNERIFIITFCITLICKLLQPNFSDDLENGARLRRTLDPLAEKDQRHRVTFWFCCFFLFCVFEMDFLDEFCHYASPNYRRHTPRGKYYFLF